MVKIPDFDRAVIDEHKITGYLLSDSHPAGRSKAAFFKQFGFRSDAWPQFRDALLAHAKTGKALSVIETYYGKKYIISGPLVCPDSRRPNIRTVWFVKAGANTPRLVTAYRLRGDQE